MKTRAAVLNEMGVSPPYAETKPREVELDTSIGAASAPPA
jgi:hypothetical protein